MNDDSTPFPWYSLIFVSCNKEKTGLDLLLIVLVLLQETAHKESKDNHIPVLSCDSPQQQTHHDPSGALLLWMLQCKQGWSDTRDPVVTSDKQPSGWTSNAAARR
jgi:hypothetical protein